MSGEGAQQLQKLQDAGFTPEQISQWQNQQNATLSQGGYTPSAIADYWGQPPTTSTDDALRAHFTNVIGDAAAQAKGDGTNPKPFTMGDAITAGWQQSSSGLLKRGKLPDVTMPQDSPWYDKAAYDAGSFVGDIPAGVAGFFVGGGAGAETGPGALVTGTAGAFALPAAIRATAMDAYKKGEFKSAGDLMARASNIMLDTAKSYVTGAAMGAGGIGGKAAAAGLGAGAVGTAVLETAGAAAAQATMAGAMEKRLPSLGDFTETAAALLLFHTMPYAYGKAVDVAGKAIDAAAPMVGKAVDAAGAMASKAPQIRDALMNIYSKTGVPPAQVAEDIQRQPTVLQDMLTKPTGQVPDVYADQVDPHFTSQEPTPQAPSATPEPIPADRTDFTPQEAWDAVKSRIDFLGNHPGKPLSWGSLYTYYLDRLNPIKMAEKKINNGTPLAPEESPYTALRLMAGEAGRVSRFIYHGPIDFVSRKTVGEPLTDILGTFSGKPQELERWSTYLVAKKALEKGAQGIETGVNPHAAQMVVESAPAHFEDAAQRLYTFQNHVLKYYYDAGMLTSKGYRAMLDAGQSHVPFYRLFDPEERTLHQGSGKGPKRMKGNDRVIVSPLESIIGNVHNFITLADMNAAKLKFVETMEKHAAEAGLTFEKQKAPKVKTTVTDKEMTDFLAQYGVDNPPKALLSVFRVGRRALASNEIRVMRDGKPETYRVDPEIAEAVRNAGTLPIHPIMRWLSLPARLLRMGTIFNPEFAARNIGVDQFDSAVLSKSWAPPFYNTIRYLSHYLGKSELYQDWLTSGGANASIVAMDRNYFRQHLHDLTHPGSAAQYLWNLVKSPEERKGLILKMISDESSTLAGSALNPGEALQRLTEHSDNITRFANYVADRKVGGSMESGGMASREGTVDFARMGSKTGGMNMIDAFFNVGLQGPDRLARAFKENPGRTMAKIGLYVALPSLFQWYANKDDPRVQNLPAWQRMMYWMIPLDDWKTAPNGQAIPDGVYPERIGPDGQKQYNMGTVLKIRKPHEAGVLFGSGIESFLNWAYDKDPHAMKNYLDSIMNTVAPNYIPQIAQPMFEQWANKSLLTGGSIIPASTEELLPEVQYKPYTTQLARSLGQFVSHVPGLNVPGSIASPAVIENYIRSWSGGLGFYALQTADYALRKAGALPDPVTPAPTLADMPFIKGFVARYPSASTQSIQDFYDRYESSKQILGTLRYRMKIGDPTVVDAMKNLNIDDVIGQVESTKKALSNQQQMIQMIYRAPMTTTPEKDLTPKERDDIAAQKRQLIDGLYYAMTVEAKHTNDALRQIDEKLAAKKQP